MATKKASRKRSSKNSNRAPATAPGQFLGYGLQYTRLTAMLLEGPEGSICSVEVLDDIAQVNQDGNVVLSQSKSSLGANPISDRAVALWKTIYNWLTLVNLGKVEIATTVFELYVSRPFNGNLAEQIAAAATEKDAVDAIEAARTELWGQAPHFNQKSKLSADLARYVNPVLESDIDTLASLVMRIRLVCGSGSPQRDIETALKRKFVSPKNVLLVANQMCGWVKRVVDLQIEDNLPAHVNRDDFHIEALAFIRMIDRELILSSRAPRPSFEQKTQRFKDVFVQQLQLIQLDESAQLEAISDYMLSSADRVLWAQAGDVHQNSFDELETSLCRLWRNTKDSVHIEHASRDHVSQGHLVYLGCMKHRIPVQGMTPPDHFLPGCFHQLSDKLSVGWHPTYKEMLAEINN